MAPQSLVFVTGNPNKLSEVQAILADDDHPVPYSVSSRDLDIPEIQGTIEDIALEKCRRAAQLIRGPCITEDTALCFAALNGLPGPYIKPFLLSLGHSGLNTLLTGFPTTAASAVCTFAYSSGPDAEPILFQGKTDGRIVMPRGDTKFGWDPIFEVDGTGKTYGEMDNEEKNKLSHRYKALVKLKDYLRAQSDGRLKE